MPQPVFPRTCIMNQLQVLLPWLYLSKVSCGFLCWAPSFTVGGTSNESNNKKRHLHFRGSLKPRFTMGIRQLSLQGFRNRKVIWRSSLRENKLSALSDQKWRMQQVSGVRDFWKAGFFLWLCEEGTGPGLITPSPERFDVAVTWHQTPNSRLKR